MLLRSGVDKIAEVQRWQRQSTLRNGFYYLHRSDFRDRHKVRPDCCIDIEVVECLRSRKFGKLNTCPHHQDVGADF